MLLAHHVPNASPDQGRRQALLPCRRIRYRHQGIPRKGHRIPQRHHHLQLRGLERFRRGRHSHLRRGQEGVERQGLRLRPAPLRAQRRVLLSQHPRRSLRRTGIEHDRLSPLAGVPARYHHVGPSRHPKHQPGPQRREGLSHLRRTSRFGLFLYLFDHAVPLRAVSHPNRRQSERMARGQGGLQDRVAPRDARVRWIGSNGLVPS
mmetsp:Transcript_16297/g.27812  ORF Transcript_16297/g.27812 Transcript_16297/m.27812 type:complete len:205 (-) Transcript_16297:1351-1965(-)